MENLQLVSSAKTPEVLFDAENGKLLLKGRSIPENSIEFYKPLYDWVDSYADQPKSETTLDVMLEYFNTSSSKCLLDLFKKLERMNGGASSVSVHWYYEEDDEDMAEAGEDYQAIIKLPFKIIEINDI
jgi:hypothetical protein